MQIARGHFIKTQRLVVVADYQGFAVLAEGDAGDVNAAALNGAHVLAVGRVPQLDVALGPCRGDQLAVRAESDTADVIRVPGVGQLFMAVGEVPELDRAVLAGGGQQGAVGAEGDIHDFLPVPQPQVAQHAGHVIFRHVGRLVRQLPAGLAIELAGLQEPPLGQGFVGPFAHVFGLVQKQRQIALGRSALDELVALGPIFLLDGADLVGGRDLGFLGRHKADQAQARERQEYGKGAFHGRDLLGEEKAPTLSIEARRRREQAVSAGSYGRGLLQ